MDVTKSYLDNLQDLTVRQQTAIKNLRKTLTLTQDRIKRKTDSEFFLEPMALQANFFSEEVYKTLRKKALDISNEKYREIEEELEKYTISPNTKHKEQGNNNEDN